MRFLTKFIFNVEHVGEEHGVRRWIKETEQKVAEHNRKTPSQNLEETSHRYQAQRVPSTLYRLFDRTIFHPPLSGKENETNHKITHQHSPTNSTYPLQRPLALHSPPRIQRNLIHTPRINTRALSLHWHKRHMHLHLRPHLPLPLPPHPLIPPITLPPLSLPQAHLLHPPQTALPAAKTLPSPAHTNSGSSPP